MAMSKGFVAVIEHGEEKHKIELIFNKLKKGIDIPTIATHIEESEDYVRHIIELADQFLPNYDNANEIAYKLDEEKYGIKL